MRCDTIDTSQVLRGYDIGLTNSDLGVKVILCREALQSLVLRERDEKHAFVPLANNGPSLSLDRGRYQDKLGAKEASAGLPQPFPTGERKPSQWTASRAVQERSLHKIRTHVANVLGRSKLLIKTRPARANMRMLFSWK